MGQSPEHNLLKKISKFCNSFSWSKQISNISGRRLWEDCTVGGEELCQQGYRLTYFNRLPKYRISRINYRKKFCCNILGDIINFNSVTRYMNKFVPAKHINVGAIHLVQLQTFQKINISYPLKRTSLCAYQEVRNVGFFEHFPYALNEWSRTECFQFLGTFIGWCLNPFSTNVPFMDKPGSWFLLAKCLKNTCGRVTF